MNLNNFKNIIKASGRYFIDIVYEGCGSACNYCYVISAIKKQKLIKSDEFQKSLESILSDKDYCSGKSGSIISLCPNTEPLKSMISIQYILLILKIFMEKGNPIQISTKEKIPLYLLEYINSHSLYPSQVMINIAIPIIRNLKKYELGTAPINERENNFSNIRKYPNISFSLYIKPFLSKSLNDIDEYIKLINRNKIEIVCLGLIISEKNDNVACTALYHKKEYTLLSLNIDFIKFRDKLLSNTRSKIFHSSICQIHYILKTKSNLKLDYNYPELCTKCGMC